MYISLSASVYVYLYISLALYLRVVALMRGRAPCVHGRLHRCQEIAPSTVHATAR